MGVSGRWEDGIFVVVGKGTYGRDDFVLLIEKAASTLGRWGPIDVLIDVREAASYRTRPSREIIASSLRVARLKGTLRRVAAVTGPDPAAFGIARMGEAHAAMEGLEAGIFHTWEEAHAWLQEGAAADPAEDPTESGVRPRLGAEVATAEAAGASPARAPESVVPPR